MTPRLSTALLLTAGTLLAAAPVSADAVDLRGPGLEAGDSYRVVRTMETEPSELDMTVQGQAMPGELSTDSEGETRVEVLDATDGSPTHVRETTLSNESVMQMTMLGQTQEQVQGQEMVGVVLERELADDGWRTEVVEGNLPAEAADLLEETGYTVPNMMYPAEPVNVGDTWTIDGEAMGLMAGAAGLPGAHVSGEAEFELVEVREIDGVLTAIMTYSMDMRLEMKMDQPGMAITIDVQMVGGGEVHRRLDRYMDDNTFEGTMAYEMSMAQGGQTIMEMTSEMPMTSRTQVTPDEDE